MSRLARPLTALIAALVAILLGLAAWVWSALFTWAALFTAWLYLVAAASFVIAVMAAQAELEGWRTNAADAWPWQHSVRAWGLTLLACAYCGTVIWLVAGRVL